MYRTVMMKLALAVLTIAIAAQPPKAHAIVLDWFNGVVTPQFGSDCHAANDLMSAYDGESILPSGWAPAIGEVFYAHLVLAQAGGTACIPSTSVIGIQLFLPAGVAPAISAANPLFCFAYLPPNSSHSNAILDNLGTDPGYGCPQTLTAVAGGGLALYAPVGYMNSHAWATDTGFWLEFLVPLKATAAQNGTNQITFGVNPQLGVFGYPSVNLFVDGDVIFRSPFEDQNLTLDICTVSPIATGC